MDEGDDVKNVSEFSSILVDTIQEAKDKISDIEHLLCSQLYSVFQSKSEQDSLKEKEKDLIHQIEDLQLLNQQIAEENRCLKLENEKALAQLNEKRKLLLAKQDRIDELECEVKKHSRKIDEGLELQNKLFKMVYANTCTLVGDEKQLKDYEEKTNLLLAQVQKSEKRIAELDVELRRKTEKVADKKELARDLMGRVEALCKERQETTIKHVKEKEELVGKLQVLERSICILQNKFKEAGEHEEGKRVQAQLLQQIDVNDGEISQQLEEAENEGKLLLQKSIGLEEKINELQENVRVSVEVVAQIDQYKSLKSDYIENQRSLVHQQNLKTTQSATEIKEVKTENEVSNRVEGDQVVNPSPSFSQLVNGRQTDAFFAYLRELREHFTSSVAR